MLAVMVYLWSVPVFLVPQDKDDSSFYVINNNNNNNNNREGINRG